MKNNLNRFLEPDEIKEKNTSIIRLLKDNKLEQAEDIYNKLVKYNPFDATVHFEFSLIYANKKMYKKSVAQLTLAHDIDETFIEKATDKAFKTIPKELIDTIKEKELSRKWNVIEFNQIEPNINTYGVKLHFKEKYINKRLFFSTAFTERVQNYFRLGYYESEEDEVSAEEAFFDVDSDCDRTYVHYVQVILAIKEMSPYLRDCRFFMETECKNFVDEIIINDSKFYSIRHYCKDPHWDSKLEAIENISAITPEDLQLKKYVSQIRCEWTEFELRTNVNK